MDYAYTGCAGECAVAIMFGIPWEPTPGLDEDEGDVAGWWVRATQHETGRLLVHGNEPDTRPFCLVTVDMPWACVRGWLYGYEVKQDRYWVEPQKGRPCYLAPQRRLSPVAQMKPWPKQLGDMPWGRWED